MKTFTVKLNITIYKGMGLPPKYICSQRMTSGIPSAKDSYPQFEVRCDIEWVSLNYAFSYDVILALCDIYNNKVLHFKFTTVIHRLFFLGMFLKVPGPRFRKMNFL